MEEEKQQGIKERVMDKIHAQRVIKITFPINVYEKLDSFAKENTNDCYWLAVKQLLDFYEESKEADSRILMLMQRDDDLLVEINRLAKDVEELKGEKNKPREVKHFGTKLEKDVKKDEKQT